jgi:hypothetical protein
MEEVDAELRSLMDELTEELELNSIPSHLFAK